MNDNGIITSGPAPGAGGNSKKLTEFDGQKHTNALIEASCLIGYAHGLCDGLQPANNQMGERQDNNTAAAAFGVMASALLATYELVSETEFDFSQAYGVRYGSQPTESHDKADISTLARKDELKRQILREAESLTDDGLEEYTAVIAKRREIAGLIDGMTDPQLDKALDMLLAWLCRGGGDENV